MSYYLHRLQQKDGPWEGASRAVGAIWSPLFRSQQRRSNELYHISDWLPTLSKVAGVPSNILDKNLDGVDIWQSLSENLPSPRKDLLIIADQTTPYCSYIRGNYKIVNGTRLHGAYDTWLGKNYEDNEDFRDNYGSRVVESLAGRALSKFATEDIDSLETLRARAQISCNGKETIHRRGSAACEPLVRPCLFDIVADPCETTNIADQLPEVYAELLEEANEYMRKAMPVKNKPSDPRADPILHHNVWSNWFDEV